MIAIIPDIKYLRGGMDCGFIVHVGDGSFFFFVVVVCVNLRRRIFSKTCC